EGSRGDRFTSSSDTLSVVVLVTGLHHSMGHYYLTRLNTRVDSRSEVAPGNSDFVSQAACVTGSLLVP
ncbi:hypothetical protein ACFWB0_22080, partial [Rhodococcus sp. NPDC060086]|uniref:hypothetical protein n=1 Tax=Rhodococcus sp. NPDC060086 TaxID=3347055 RepID=UPI003661CBA4